jgi:Kef-type K+ transport system membrane component KefB
MIQIFLTDPIEKLSILVFIILIVPYICKYLKIPSLFGLITAGIIISPYALNVIAFDANLNLLQTLGLLYIMFIAGLELNLEILQSTKIKSSIFGILSGLVPGIISFYLSISYLNSDVLFSLLIANIIASHNIIAYSIVSSAGIQKDELVVVTIAGTMITDISALLMLAMIVGVYNEGTITFKFFLIFTINVAVFLIVSLIFLPRVAKFFFKNEHTTEIEFLFTFLSMLAISALAKMIGLEDIIGAFFAGLALNRLIPKDTRLFHITEFFGQSLLIPIFMIYVGMLININVIFEGNLTIIYSTIFVFSLITGKLIASVIYSLLFNVTFNRMMLMFSLTIPQVGVTLATIFVGMKIGLLSSEALNGGIILVIVTSLGGPILTSKYSQKIIPGAQQSSTSLAKKSQKLNMLVLVDPQLTDSRLIDLSGIIIKRTKGILYPINVLQKADINKYENLDVSVSNKRISDKLIEKVVKLTNELNIEAIPIQRVDDTIVEGILNASIENNINIIFLDWKGNPSHKTYYFSQLIDKLLNQSFNPLVITRFTQSLSLITRIVIIVTEQEYFSRFFQFYLKIGTILSSSINCKLLIIDALKTKFSIKDKLDTIIQEIKYEYLKLEILSARRLNQILNTTDFVSITIPSNHPVFESQWSTEAVGLLSHPTLFYSLINKPYSCLFYCFRGNL